MPDPSNFPTLPRCKRPLLSVLLCALLLLTSMAVVPGRARPDDDTALRPAEALARIGTELDEIEEEVVGGGSSRRERLPTLIVVLTELARSPGLNDTGRLVARVLRGMALSLEIRIRMREGAAVDTALARTALEDFDAVLASSGRLPPVIPVDEVEYRAGLVALVSSP
jgi:hypothetical protein